jgi:Tol biopolymer transport system component
MTRTLSIRRFTAVAVAGLLGAVLLGAQKADQADVAFQAAINKEMVQGDLKGAIDQYKKLADGSDKAIAAKALLRMAGCYEKLGQRDAQAVYERIVKDFAGQTDSAATARARLAALGTGQATSPARVWPHVAWTAPGHSTFVSNMSADGRYISYEMADDGDDLWLHDLVTGVNRRLTKAADPADTNAEAWGESAFSRDGTQLAYGWGSDEADLRVINLQGSELPRPRSLAKGGFYPFDWTPDGKWIAVVTARKPDGNQIALVSTSDGSLRVLKSLDPPTASKGAMYFSPDGKYLAVDISDRSDRGVHAGKILLLAIDGHQETPAVNRAGDVLVGWSPDGTQLLFTSDRTGSNGLFALRVNDGRPQGEPKLIKPDVGRLWALSVTTSGSLYYRDGQETYTYRPNFDIKIGSFDLTTGALSPLKDLLLEDFTASNRSPEWSPDGTALAYVVERGSRPGDFSVAVRTLATDEVQLLRPLLGHVEWLSWAPDGRSFVMMGSDLNGASGLFRVDRATGAVSAIAAGGASDLRFHGWSPDARKVYYQRGLVGHQVLIERDLASGLERELYQAGPSLIGMLSADRQKVYYRRSKVSDSLPADLQAAFIERDLASGVERELIRGNLGLPYLSPDGRYFVASDIDLSTPSKSIVLVPVAGGEPRVLMRVALPQSIVDQAMTSRNLLALPRLDVLWAPDSRSLVLQHTFDDLHERWWAPVDGREPPKRVSLGVKVPTLGSVRVHPDGRRMAITVREQRVWRPADVWVIESVVPKAGAKR